MAFTHYTVKKIIHGSGSIKQAPKEVKNLGGSRVLIVMDPGLAKLGVQKPLEDALTEGGVAWELFAKAELEPSMDSIQACADAAAAFKADVLIGFGGGSALDTTKAASVLLSNEGPIDRYFGTNLVPNPTLPKILIPTTAGTGSEMTNISVLADTKNGGKKGVVSEYMYAEVVLLDAALTVGLPPRVTAMTGVDAFVHAMESYCGIAATPITDALNLAAMKLVGANIRQAFANGSNLAARDAMLYGSALAGMGFGNTQNGIIHAIGTTLPVECHIPHGLAMSICSPFSVGFNYIANPEKYAIVADILRGDDRTGVLSVLERAADVEPAFRALLRDLDIKTGLKNYGVKREDLPASADRAFAAKRLLDNNPRKASRDQILALLEANYEE
jgi:alcohol dehydrogenase